MKCERERIEWTNSWWEDANAPEKDRWVIIGDSVARQFRGSIQDKVGKNIALDFFGSSLQVSDVKIIDELNNFFCNSDYKYKKVFVNYGAHHGIRPEQLSVDDEKKLFESGYNRIIDLIMKYCDDLVIISATHHVKRSDLNQIDVLVNSRIEIRNAIMKNVAEQKNFIFIDLYKYMLSEGALKFKHTDHVHFERTSDSYMAAYILSQIGFQTEYTIDNVLNSFIDNIKDLIDICAGKNVYIYGCGIRGNRLNSFLNMKGIGVVNYIISDSQLKNGSELFFSEYLKQKKCNDIVFNAVANDIGDSVKKQMSCYSLSNYIWDFFRDVQAFVL